ncbi:hypothetical protein NBO_6g0098 [Nosema bombycis CQ1]|uniref:Uncharacterized protein n=1 Tax=Nosema bombycis (strain CQ1 / CVCC 102059) TaxID=578461 RepID=R0MR40_NOSB1|nr:hypothetical protein NBO_6g0098 [Nosema bombycis CQ1]|eukprot:EOB15348.1 hypothetical protein NBO_6g0098 [Nosema bombycis CQ1]
MFVYVFHFEKSFTSNHKDVKFWLMRSFLRMFLYNFYQFNLNHFNSNHLNLISPLIFTLNKIKVF